MERGRASAGLAPSPQAPRCDPHPRSPASLLPSFSALGTSRSLSLYLLHREADGGALTHMEVGAPVGPSPAPTLHGREITAQAAQVRSNRGVLASEALTWSPRPLLTACHGASGREAGAALGHVDPGSGGAQRSAGFG